MGAHSPMGSGTLRKGTDHFGGSTAKSVWSCQLHLKFMWTIGASFAGKKKRLACLLETNSATFQYQGKTCNHVITQIYHNIPNYYQLHLAYTPVIPGLFTISPFLTLQCSTTPCLEALHEAVRQAAQALHSLSLCAKCPSSCAKR